MVLVTALCLTAAASFAQAPSGRGGEDLFAGESARQIHLTGTSVVEVAQFVAGVVSDSGTVPDWVQARTDSGRLQRLTATDAFVVLARTLYYWDTNGRLPEAVPVAVGGVTPPVLATADLPDAEREPAPTKGIATDLFVSQAQEVLRRMDQFRLVPTAVGVGRDRLSAAQYLAGMAVAIDYASRTGKLDPVLYVPEVAPPPAWVAHTSLIAERIPRPFASEVDPANAAAPAPSGPVPPVRPQTVEVPKMPALAISPGSGKVGGTLDIVANYTGPAARFAVFQLDGETKAITNTPPYSYRLGTHALSVGPHTFVVRMLGENDAEIIRATVTYTLLPPSVPKRATAEKAAKPAPTK